MIDRLRAASQSQDQGVEQLEGSSVNADMDERLMPPSCSNNKLIFEDLFAFLENKVREVCRCEIEKLKFEASDSYVNELVISL